jgi:hypothetical protein
MHGSRQGLENTAKFAHLSAEKDVLHSYACKARIAVKSHLGFLCNLRNQNCGSLIESRQQKNPLGFKNVKITPFGSIFVLTSQNQPIHQNQPAPASRKLTCPPRAAVAGPSQ